MSDDEREKMMREMGEKLATGRAGRPEDVAESYLGVVGNYIWRSNTNQLPSILKKGRSIYITSFVALLTYYMLSPTREHEITPRNCAVQ